VRVLVSINTDDNIEVFCQNRHGSSFQQVGISLGSFGLAAPATL
jgi:hypothetical protein